MTPETRQALQERRDVLAAQLEEAEAAGTAPPRELQGLVRQVDSLLKVQAPAVAPGAEGEIVHLARIGKGERTELRVSIREWKGRQRVELRQWYLPVDGSDWRPKQRGIAISARNLDAVVAALVLAKESLGGDVSDR